LKVLPLDYVVVCPHSAPKPKFLPQDYAHLSYFTVILIIGPLASLLVYRTCVTVIDHDDRTHHSPKKRAKRVPQQLHTSATLVILRSHFPWPADDRPGQLHLVHCATHAHGRAPRRRYPTAMDHQCLPTCAGRFIAGHWHLGG